MKNSLVLFLVLTLGSCSTVKVAHLKPEDKLGAEFYYALPQLDVQVSIPITELTYTKGSNFINKLSSDDLNQLAKLVGIDTSIYETLKEGKSTSVTKFKVGEASVAYTSSIDKNKIFSVKLNSFLSKKDFSFQTNPSGIATDIESSSETLIDDYVFGALSAIGTVLGAVKGGEDKKRSLFDNEKLQELSLLLSDYNDLTSNQGKNVIMDSEVYKDQLSKIEKRIQTLVSQYIYKSKSTERIANIVLTPLEGCAYDTSHPFVGIDPEKGVVIPSKKNDNFTTTIFYPYQISHKRKNINQETCLKFYFKINNMSNPILTKVSEVNSSKKTGYAYNVPAYCKVEFGKIEKGKTTEIILKQEGVKIPQKGKVAYLSKKQAKVKLVLDPLTGELRSAASEGAGGNAGLVDSATASAEKLLNALKKDELSELEKEVKILELRKQKKELLGY